MQRYITISEGKKLSLKNYLSIVKLAKANPEAEFPRSFCGWWPVKGYEILQQFHAGCVDRINQGIPAIKRGI